MSSQMRFDILQGLRKYRRGVRPIRVKGNRLLVTALRFTRTMNGHWSLFAIPTTTLA
jgi:hypothetical protein